MTDIATMTARILDETKRPALTTEVMTAIESAIAHANQDEMYFFQEERAEMTLSTSSTPVARLYALPTDFAFPVGTQAMQITANSSTYPITLVAFRDLDEADLENANSGQGIPGTWAYYDQQIRFYPVPSLGTSYVARLNYIKTLDSTNADWYDAAERAIRYRAKMYLYNDTIHQYAKADRMEAEMVKAERALRRLGNRRRTTGRLAAWGY